jgi:hypothetical protein
MESRYVKINNNYSSYALVDVLRSRGDPIIGHRISDRISHFSKRNIYKREADVHFLEFIDPFVKDINSMSYDTPPLKDLYTRLQEREHCLKFHKEFAERQCSTAREPGFDQWIAFNSPTVREKRWQRLQAQCEYQLNRNATRILEEMCSAYLYSPFKKK